MDNKELQTQDNQSLSAEEIKFTRLLAKGFSYTKAYRLSFPTAKGLAYDTVRRKASTLATKRNIITEVQTTRQKTAHLARLAEDRLEQILEDDDSQRKGNKVAEVSMFMYEQANGKATQKIEQKSLAVSVTYDLTGGNEPVPQEILDQLQNK